MVEEQSYFRVLEKKETYLLRYLLDIQMKRIFFCITAIYFPIFIMCIRTKKIKKNDINKLNMVCFTLNNLLINMINYL